MLTPLTGRSRSTKGGLIAGFVAALCALAGTGDAAPEHKNLQVLPKGIAPAKLKEMMDGFTKQLGVKCTFCHVADQYEKDDRPHKADARRMIRLVLDMKAGKTAYFGANLKESMISCGLCHRGQAEPEPFVGSFLRALNFVAPQGSGGKPKNLQVLPRNTSSSEVGKVMDGFTEQLGVKCESCHGPQVETDDRPQKAGARRMMRLVMDMKAKRAEYFGPRVKEGVITCGICHRGKAKPEPLVS